MSDQPGPETESVPVLDRESAQQLRWLAGGIWLAVFLGLLVTSYAGIVGPMSNIDLALLNLENFQAGFGDEEYSPDGNLIAGTALVITFVIGILILLLWTMFGRVTTALLGAFSDAERDAVSGPAPSVWLSADGERSTLSDLMLLGGLTWALLILRPVLIGALRILTA